MSELPLLGLESEDALPRDVVRRVWLLRAAMLLVLAGLVVRLWVLQVVRYSQYERQAGANRVRLVPTDAPRGGIYDSRGRVIATCRIAYRVAILNLAAERQPRRAGGDGDDRPRPTVGEQLAELRRLVDLEPAALEQARRDLAQLDRPRFQPVVIKEDLSLHERTRIEERLWRLPNVILERVPLRWYPAGPVTSHLTGYVGSISPAKLAARQERQDEEIRALEAELSAAQRSLPEGQEQSLAALAERIAVLERLRRRTDVIVGIDGLEQQYDAELEGEPGLRTWQVSASGAPVQLLGVTDGEAGGALLLNLDLDLQRLAMRQLRGRRGAVVAIDPRDGAVLCVAASPSYDANAFIPRISSADYRAILANTDHPLQNRAIQNTYAPGSTFKMISATAGLTAGVMSPGFGVGCGGGLRIGRTFKKCWAVHGGVGLNAAIAHSCDTYFYAAALRMGPEAIREAARGFGLGQPTGLDLPGEKSGRVPDEAWHESHHDRRWSAGDTANISIGQGDIAASVVQMAHVTAAVANGATAYRPQLVREVRDRTRRRVLRPWRPEPVGAVGVPRALIEQVRAGMRAAVTAGTARIVNLPGVRVAGKTGSAEDPPRRLPHAWFVCFAPYEEPTIAIAVLVENVGHGSEFAGPVARALLEQHLGLGEPE